MEEKQKLRFIGKRYRKYFKTNFMNEKIKPSFPGEVRKEKTIRDMMDDLLDAHQFDQIADLEGIEKVGDRRDWMKGEEHYTCTSHVFSKGKYVEWEIENREYKHPKGYTEVESPQEGDVVFYFHGESPEHVGIYVGDGKVESKFGIGHIYKHPTESVPTYYGTPRFFRKD